MPATKKVGTQLLVSPLLKARAQALAVVRQESMAEIYRIALEGNGLAHMERPIKVLLDTLIDALDHQHVDRWDALQYMLDNKMTIGSVLDEYGRPLDRFPGNLPRLR